MTDLPWKFVFDRICPRHGASRPRGTNHATATLSGGRLADGSAGGLVPLWLPCPSIRAAVPRGAGWRYGRGRLTFAACFTGGRIQIIYLTCFIF